jgi:hypothetical protein
MTALSLFGVVLGAFVRDTTLERKKAEERESAERVSEEQKAEALAH